MIAFCLFICLHSLSLFHPNVKKNNTQNSQNNRSNIVNTHVGFSIVQSDDKDSQNMIVDKQTVLIKTSTPSPKMNKLATIASENNKIHISQTAQMVQCAGATAANVATSPASVSNANSNNSAPTITTMESGGIKITYDKNLSAKTSQVQSQEDISGRMSR